MTNTARIRTNIRLAAGLVGLAGAFFCVPAQAIGGAMVLGGGTCAVYTEGGPIASEVTVEETQQQLGQMNSSLSMLLNRIGQSVTAQQQATTQTLSTIASHQDEANRNIAVQNSVARLKAQAAIDEKPVNQVENNCDAPQMAAGSQVGGLANRQLTKIIASSASLHDTSYARASDAAAAIVKVPVAAYQTDSVFNSTGTMSLQQVSYAHSWLDAVSAPRPYVALPTPASGQLTPAQVRYNAAVRVNTARLVVPQETLALITAEHAPSINVGTWASDTWAAMTGSQKGAPPSVVNGRMSDNAVMGLQVKSRYANPSWYALLAQKNSVGVLREIATLDAVRAHMEFVRLRLEEREAAMLAQMASQQANRAERRQISAASAQ